MTKNLTQLSQVLLSKFLDSNNQPVSGKFCTPEDLQAEIEALKQLLPGSCWESPSGARVFDFMHQGTKCLALTFVLSDDEQMDLITQSESTIKQIEIPGSIFLFLADCLNLRPIEFDPMIIDQYIAGPASGEDGVELEVVKQYLEGISVFQLSDVSIFKPQIPERYVANYICTFDPCLKKNNRLTPNSLAIIREIFLQEKYHLIEVNLFESMKTPLLRHSFLEIYRTLEFIFVLPRANALLTELRLAGASLDIQILEFARHCYQELGWRRIERDSLVKLFEEYATSNYSAFQTLTSSCQPFSTLTAISSTALVAEKNNFVVKIAEKYYQLRNQVVHQFWSDEMLLCNDESWQSLIEFTLGCISYFYTSYLNKT